MKTICSVRCNVKPSLFISEDDGYLELLEVAHAAGFLIRYMQSRRVKVAECELESIKLSDFDHSCQLPCAGERNSGLLQVFVINVADFLLFSDAVADASKLINVTLQLNSTVRDIYYSHVYSVLDPDEDIIFCDELMVANQGRSFDNKELVRFKQRPISIISQTLSRPPSDYSKFKVECVYCDSTKIQEPSQEFIVHPYVESNYDAKPLFFCMSCAENWKEYREQAIREDMLVLDGECNEEICCICSNMPDELVLCSKCPRSYCNPCLQKVVTPTRYQQIVADAEADWLCMTCACNLDSVALMSKSTWKFVRSSASTVATSPGPAASNLSDADQRSTRRGSPGLLNQTVHSHSGSASSSSSSPSIRAVGQATKAPDTGKTSTKLFTPPTATTIETIDPIIARNTALMKFAVSLSVLGQEAWSSSEAAILVAAMEKRKWKAGSELLREEEFRQSMSSKSSIRMILNRREDLHELWTQALNGTTDVNQKPRSLGQSHGPISGPDKGDKKQHESDAQGPTDGIQNRPKSHHKQNQYDKHPVAVAAVSKAASGNKPATNGGGSKKRSKTVSETFYFGQYINYIDSLAAQLATTKSLSVKSQYTEDACFLCKDGGELIECDHVDGRKCRCKKVYHEYCLSYSVPENYRRWLCPRHFCDCCGSQELKYICKYCPLSVCASCPEMVVRLYGLARYTFCFEPSSQLNSVENESFTIVCQNCQDSISQCKLSGDLPPEYEVAGESRMFPGKYDPSACGTWVQPIDHNAAGAQDTKRRRIIPGTQDAEFSDRVKTSEGQTNRVAVDLKSLTEAPSRFGRQRQPSSRIVNA